MQDNSIGDTSYTLITIYMYLLRILISEHLSKSNQNFTYPFRLYQTYATNFYSGCMHKTALALALRVVIVVIA